MNIKERIHPFVFEKESDLYFTPKAELISTPPINPPICAALSIPGKINPKHKLRRIKGIS